MEDALTNTELKKRRARGLSTQQSLCSQITTPSMQQKVTGLQHPRTAERSERTRMDTAELESRRRRERKIQRKQRKIKAEREAKLLQKTQQQKVLQEATSMWQQAQHRREQNMLSFECDGTSKIEHPAVRGYALEPLEDGFHPRSFSPAFFGYHTVSVSGQWSVACHVRLFGVKRVDFSEEHGIVLREAVASVLNDVALTCGKRTALGSASVVLEDLNALDDPDTVTRVRRKLERRSTRSAGSTISYHMQKNLAHLEQGGVMSLRIRIVPLCVDELFVGRGLVPPHHQLDGNPVVLASVCSSKEEQALHLATAANVSRHEMRELAAPLVDLSFGVDSKERSVCERLAAALGKAVADGRVTEAIAYCTAAEGTTAQPPISLALTYMPSVQCSDAALDFSIANDTPRMRASAARTILCASSLTLHAMLRHAILGQLDTSTSCDEHDSPLVLRPSSNQAAFRLHSDHLPHSKESEISENDDSFVASVLHRYDAVRALHPVFSGRSDWPHSRPSAERVHPIFWGHAERRLVPTPPLPCYPGGPANPKSRHPSFGFNVVLPNARTASTTSLSMTDATFCTPVWWGYRIAQPLLPPVGAELSLGGAKLPKRRMHLDTKAREDKKVRHPANERKMPRSNRRVHRIERNSKRTECERERESCDCQLVMLVHPATMGYCEVLPKDGDSPNFNVELCSPVCFGYNPAVPAVSLPLLSEIVHPSCVGQRLMRRDLGALPTALSAEVVSPTFFGYGLNRGSRFERKRTNKYTLFQRRATEVKGSMSLEGSQGCTICFGAEIPGCPRCWKADFRNNVLDCSRSDYSEARGSAIRGKVAALANPSALIGKRRGQDAVVRSRPGREQKLALSTALSNQLSIHTTLISSDAIRRCREREAVIVNVFVKMLPVGDVVSFVIDARRSLRYLHFLYRTAAPASIATQKKVHLLLPTSRGLFHLDEETSLADDCFLAKENGSRTLMEDYNVVRSCTLCMFQVPSLQHPRADRIVMTFIKQNLQLRDSKNSPNQHLPESSALPATIAASAAHETVLLHPDHDHSWEKSHSMERGMVLPSVELHETLDTVPSELPGADSLQHSLLRGLKETIEVQRRVREADEAELRAKKQLEIRENVNRRLKQRLAEERKRRNLTPQQLERERKKKEREEQLTKYRATKARKERPRTPPGVRLAQKRERLRLDRLRAPQVQHEEMESPKSAPGALQATRERFRAMLTFRRLKVESEIEENADATRVQQRRMSLIATMGKLSPNLKQKDRSSPKLRNLSPKQLGTAMRRSSRSLLGSNNSDDAKGQVTATRQKQLQRMATIRQQRKLTLAAAGEQAIRGGQGEKYRVTSN